ncbi:MAG: transporter substrate-binding domain-containing protein [Pseudomonadota bacterium]
MTSSRARTVLLIAQLWLGLALCAPARAAQELVFAFSELEPWKTVDAANNYGGAYTEIVRELARRLNLPLKIVPCPLKRCLVMLEHGEADIVIGIQDSGERAQYIQFLHTPYRERGSDKVFYVRKGMAARIQKFEDLRTLRVGVKNGAMNFARFEEANELLKVGARDINTNFRKLVLGRLDTVIASEDQGEAILSQMHLREQVEKAIYRSSETAVPRAIGISKKSAHLADIKRFEAAMGDMTKDGTLQKIYRRHYFEAYQIPLNSVPGL